MIKGGYTKSSAAAETNNQEQKVLQVARKLAATIGMDFFQATAKHLAKAVAADCVLIGELVGGQMERVRTLGAWMDNQPVSFEFELAGSAAAELAFGKPCLYRSDVQSRFPSDKLLAEIGAHAVIGLPLLDQQGRPIGLILALYRHPTARTSMSKQLLQIFSARAAAELRRKKQEDDLRESEQRYRAFISRSADAMWRIEFERSIDTSLSAPDQLEEMYRYGYLAECNDALAHQWGLEKAEQIIGSSLEHLVPRSDPELEEANLNAIRHGYDCTTTEVIWVDKLGRRRHLLRSQWGIVEDGMLERIWGTTRDITDLKLSEEELDASEKRMSHLLQTMKLVVVIEDPAGAITYCNKYFYRRTGWTAAAVKGKTWPDLLSPPEERSKLLAKFESARAKPETPIHFESILLGPDAQRWHFDWDRTVLRNAAGNVAAWASLGRDVTEHKALEACLRQAQKLATIGKLAGGVAHDFNNLLTVILGYSGRLLEDREHLDPTTGTALEEIRKAASKGADLTHRLLAFGRRQVLRPEILNLNLLISDSAQMLRSLIGADIHFTTVLDPSAGLVRIDAGSFHQVLMNLAVNARDAMPHGGSLTIATAKVTISESEKEKFLAPGDYVEVTVTDSGTGMTEEVRDHLFEPFFTTKDEGKGTGLGLAVVYGIVQQSGGSILVESEPGKGTTFRLYFPRVTETPKAATDKDTPIVVERGSETVLLVEDREDVRELTARTLRDLGYTVHEADSPERALEIGLDRSRTIHLLLTDIVMPRINGFDLAARIRTYHNGLKVLFMSGYTDPLRVSEKVTQPGSAYLQKPFTPQALGITIRNLLDGR
jgi:two-component system, cell cycle sensor histidine kinase and response regulator CckA